MNQQDASPTHVVPCWSLCLQCTNTIQSRTSSGEDVLGSQENATPAAVLGGKADVVLVTESAAERISRRILIISFLT